MQKTETDTNTFSGSGDRMQGAPRVRDVAGDEAARRYGCAQKDIIDFSSNVNPLGPSSATIRAAKRSLSSIDRYPDPDMNRLRRAVARYFGIKPGQVVCGNGSTELINLIPRVFRPRKVLIPTPTFQEYAAAVVQAGGEVVALPLQERTGFRIDPLDMAFSLKGMDMAFLCNPNNPTGVLMSKTEMLEIVKYGLEQGVRIVVDEAFVDFANAESIVKEAVLASNLIVVRSFGIFFGMPGLRVGYAVCDETTAEALRSGQEPWTVNSAGEQAAIAALEDWRHARRTLRLIQKERERLLSAVRILPGVDTFPSSANFIFIKVPAPQAPLLAEKLAQRGFCVRDCSSFPGLDKRFLTIAVRIRRENKKLIQALRALIH